MRRRRVSTRGSLHNWMIVALTGLALLLFPAAAGAWAQYYVVTQTFQPGGVETSASNGSLNYNYTAFDGICCDFMMLNLCPTSGSCYSYHDCYNDCADTRSISYGYAKCTAYSGNNNALDVNSCYVRNIYG